MTNARVMQVATSLNSALANYDNKTVTATKYYNKTESDNNYPRFPDYGSGMVIPSSPWTAIFDCYLTNFTTVFISSPDPSITINGIEVVYADGVPPDIRGGYFCGYIKKGDIITTSNIAKTHIYPLR